MKIHLISSDLIFSRHLVCKLISFILAMTLDPESITRILLILAFKLLIYMLHDIFLKYLWVFRLFTMILLKRLSAIFYVEENLCVLWQFWDDNTYYHKFLFDIYLQSWTMMGKKGKGQCHIVCCLHES